MSRSVYYHVDRTEVAFPHDNQEYIVSLVPYLQHPSDAVAVVYEIWNESLLEEGSRWLVQTAGEKVDFVHEGIMHHADRLDGVSKEVTVLAESPKVHICIAAELLSPGSVIHAAKIDKSPTGSSEINTWVNRSVTLQGEDSGSDVDSVLLLVRAFDLEAGASEFGLRGIGSTVTKLWKHAYHTCNFFFPIRAPNGQYQIYIQGKASPFSFKTYVWELGYIKDGTFKGILNYVDEVPGTSETWQEIAAGSTVAAGADGIFAVQYLTHPGGDVLCWHGTRTIGSTDDEGISPVVSPCDSADPVKLDGSKQYEYMAHGPNPQTWILAYTMLAEVSGSATIKLTAQAEATLPTTFSATPAIEDVFSAVPTVEFVLSALPDLGDVLSASPALESVLSGIADVEDVITGRPTIPEGS